MEQDTHSKSQHGIGRRQLLLGGLLAGAAGILHPSGILIAAQTPGQTPPPVEPKLTPGVSRVLRFAHPTDIHVWNQNRGDAGMSAALAHMVSLKDPPQMVINGGDCPMDSASTPYAESKIEWDLFMQILRQQVPAGVPVYSALGNHDIFGRNRKKSLTSGQEAEYGRKWFCDNFQCPRTFQSFDRAGWHFIILDSIDWAPSSIDAEYAARITGEQLDWLKQDLRSTPSTTPVVIVSHVPVMSVANFFDGPDEEWKPGDQTFELESSRMHIDCRELEALFRSHGNVKLCLSGHLHLLDKCQYNGITYICDGAVSSNKWKGVRRQTPNGYGLIDLYSDGSFQHQYMTYGWSS